jgi:hypothetical protein
MRLLVDLLDIADPRDIGGPLMGIPDDRFNFPGQSVESVTPANDFTLLVGLDTNYPGGNGRVPGTPDDTAIITLRFREPLDKLRVDGHGRGGTMMIITEVMIDTGATVANAKDRGLA